MPAPNSIRNWLARRPGAEARAVSRFKRNGCRPWSPGYTEYKWAALGTALARPDFPAAAGMPGYGYRLDERIVELPWFFSRLPAGPGTLLDAGSALNHPPLLDHPRLAGKRLFISTLAPERRAQWDRGISYVYEDLRQTCFRADFFDWIACISTLEHVGLDNTVLYTGDPARKETDREGYLELVDVLRSRLKPGGRLFLSVPFGRRKNHGWFQVFDGRMLDGIRSRFAPAECRETVFMYADDRWNLADRDSARDATCFDVHAGLPPAPDHCAFSRAVACLELTR